MAIVIAPDEGTHLPGEFMVTIKIRSEQTGGGFAVLEETLPRRRLIKPHTHGNDVWVGPLDGEVGVLVSDEVIAVLPGRVGVEACRFGTCDVESDRPTDPHH